MNPSIPSHTPRVRPLGYDALRNTLGCQSITGSAHLATLPFERVCVEDSIFDSIEVRFQKPRTVSYCAGPSELGEPQTAKFGATWAAWVGSKGVRIGKFPSVTPPSNNIGKTSSLFPSTKPEQLSIGFNSKALMAIAVQTGETITLKRFIDAATGEVATYSWPGVSPQLFLNWLVYFDENKGGDDLVCYYLNPVRRNVLYARFERDNFAIERIIHPDLPVYIDYIVNSFVENRFTQVLLARTSGGESATFTSPIYGVHADDKAKLSARIISGVYALVTKPLDAPVSDDKATFTASIVGGGMTELKVGSTVTDDKATLSAEIIAGAYE